jgi:hypothetical protein
MSVSRKGRKRGHFEEEEQRLVHATEVGQKRPREASLTMSVDSRGVSKMIREQKKAIISAVMCHLEPEVWHACGLSKKAVMPAIKDLRQACKGSLRCGWHKISRERQRAIYADVSAKTIMEKADGMMPAMKVRSSAGRAGILSVKAGAALFRTEVMTSALADKTRLRYHGLWQGFVTYGIAQRDLQSIMPATKEMVHAWAMQLMMLGASPSLIRASIAAVQSRHNDYGFQAPLREPRLFQRTMRAVFALQGTPRRQITPISRSMMRKLMRLRNLSAAEKRDVTLTVAGTQLCARVGEIKRLQVCDFLKNYDLGFSRRYRGSAAIRIRKRKQDRERKGLYPRLLKGTTETLCIVRRLERLMRERGLHVSDKCTKAQRPAARCPHCPPLFASFREVNGRPLPMSRQQVTGAVKRAMGLIKKDTTGFSGISMRRGGISQAVHKRVPEPILFLQSGHGSKLAARTYMVPHDPRVLYETAQALRL